MKTIAVTGAAQGLGKAIADRLDMMRRMRDGTDGGAKMFNVIRIDHAYGHDVRVPQGSMNAPDCYDGPKIVPVPVVEKLDALINCAGINRIAWFEDVDNELWEQTISTNAMAIWKMTKHYLQALSDSGTPDRREGGTVLNIVSNASHMPMRCSLAYNASKGAAHIMTLQMARELYGRHGITVFGISPNKLAGTGMSDDIDTQVMATRGWTREKAQEYQLAGLATGQETDPETLADFVCFLLSDKQRHKFLHGCILPYGA